MKTRALRAFHRTATRLQALTKEDFQQVADLEELAEFTVSTVTIAGRTADDKTTQSAATADGTEDDVGEENQDSREQAKEEEIDPTPSLSSARRTQADSKIGRLSGAVDEVKGIEGTAVDDSGGARIAVASSVLRVLRATIVILGGCGLGALPSDRDLWTAVRAMLLDGSLRHRMRHFDRCVLLARSVRGAKKTSV